MHFVAFVAWQFERKRVGMGHQRKAQGEAVEPDGCCRVTYPGSRQRVRLKGKVVHPPLLKIAALERLGKLPDLLGCDFLQRLDPIVSRGRQVGQALLRSDFLNCALEADGGAVALVTGRIGRIVGYF